MKDKLIMSGEVVEKQSNGTYKVRIRGANNVFMDIEAKLAIKNRLTFLRLLPGDKVTVELSTYNLTKGKILSLSVKETN